MKKVFIDEYLSLPLRQRIDELVDLNLDLESILSLLSNDLYQFDDYMIVEIKRYLKYLLWLKKHHKERSQAFEKYKKQTNQKHPKNEILPSNFRQNSTSIKLENEFLLSQIRKERKRIDEVSNFNHHKETEDENLKTADFFTDSIDEILETLTDEEIQSTLQAILAAEKEKGPNDVEEPKDEKTELDEPNPDPQPKSFSEETKKISDLTFDDILNENTATSPSISTAKQTLFDFDYLEDNGTQTVNDSFEVDNEEHLELQDFTTTQKEKITLVLDQQDLTETETSPTAKALQFLDELEEKYGEQTTITLDTTNIDLPTNNAKNEQKNAQKEVINHQKGK